MLAREILGLHVIVVATTAIGLTRIAVGDQKQIDLLLNAAVPAEFSRLVGVTIRGASQPQIEELKTHAEPAIALAAAWEVARRSFQGEEHHRLVALGQFIGFVEGRLCTGVPSWWKDAVAGAGNDEPNVYFVLDIGESQYGVTKVPLPPGGFEPDLGLVRDVADEPHYLLAPKTATVMKQTNGLLVSLGERSVVLPNKMLADGKRVATAIRVVFGREHVFVALHEQAPLSYGLLCFDANSGQLAWRSDVWAAGGLVDYSGSGRHWVDIQESNNWVRVFGIGFECAYIEEFSKENGRARFRFGTVYGTGWNR